MYQCIQAAGNMGEGRRAGGYRLLPATGQGWRAWASAASSCMLPGTGRGEYVGHGAPLRHVAAFLT